MPKYTHSAHVIGNSPSLQTLDEELKADNLEDAIKEVEHLYRGCPASWSIELDGELMASGWIDDVSGETGELVPDTSEFSDTSSLPWN